MKRRKIEHRTEETRVNKDRVAEMAKLQKTGVRPQDNHLYLLAHAKT
jgi:hypothetical protein